MKKARAEFSFLMKTEFTGTLLSPGCFSWKYCSNDITDSNDSRTTLVTTTEQHVALGRLCFEFFMP